MNWDFCRVEHTFRPTDFGDCIEQVFDCELTILARRLLIARCTENAQTQQKRARTGIIKPITCPVAVAREFSGRHPPDPAGAGTDIAEMDSVPLPCGREFFGKMSPGHLQFPKNWCPEEASIVTSNNLILFFKGNLVFLRGTNGGTEKILLSGSFPDPGSIHTVLIHFFPFHRKSNHYL